MSTPCEVEAKLIVTAPDPDALLRDLASCATLGPVTLGAARSQEIRDVYLDTPGGALAAWGGALRLRTKNGRPLVTVKGPGRREGARVERPEIELELTDENVRRVLEWTRAHAGGAIDPAARVDAGAMAIEGFVRIHDRRTRRIVRDGEGPGGRVELALDRATYAVGGREVTIAEVEVEAGEAGGPVDEVAAALLAAHPGGLRAWRHSKLAVGLALERLAARGELAGLLSASGAPGPVALEAIGREADDVVRRAP